MSSTSRPRRKLSKSAPKHLRLGVWLHNRRNRARAVSLFVALVFASGVFIQTIGFFMESGSYRLSGQAEALVGRPNSRLAASLKFDQKSHTYEYNEGYKPGGEVAGQSSVPKFSASFSLSSEQSTTVTDPVTKTSIIFKPKFGLKEPRQDQNRLVYPLQGKNAVKVVSLKSIGFKEDIIVNKYQGDSLDFSYELELPKGTEARMESNGALAIYGADYNLLGDVSVGSESDQKLLDTAREKAIKRNLLFTFPAPFIKEFNKKVSSKKAWFTLGGKELTIHAAGLKDASYPLTIDPSIYIETAAKLMRGNNETNVDFDVDQELIQKSQTTGARIDEWTGTQDLYATWDHGTVAAGGYIYMVGGQEVYKAVFTSTGSSSFVVPTGVTSITVKAWGAGGGGGAGSGSTGTGGAGGGGGYATETITVTPGETLAVTVGSGGDKGAANNNAGNGGGYSAVQRSSTYLVQAGGGAGGGGSQGTTNGGAGGAGGGTSGVAGTAASGGGGGAGTTSSGGSGGTAGTGGVAGSAGAANAGGNAGGSGATCSTSVSGQTGGSGDAGAGGKGGNAGSCAGGGGGGGGRFGGGGGGSGSNSSNRGGGGGGGGSSLISSGSTSAGSGTTPGNNGDSDRNGFAGGGSGATSSDTNTGGSNGVVIVSYTISGNSTALSSSVSWAKFNTSTGTVDPPNPGDGTCSSWCTNSAYNLPEGRRGHSMVAYNGYLYVIGGSDGTSLESTVFVAKLGANGEPQLWHPTDTNPNNWVYWYQDSGLNGGTARAYHAAYTYKNKMYILGGDTDTTANSGSTTTVELADILPNGKLGSWASGAALPASTGRYGHTVHVYNDTMYLIGGNNNGTMLSSVYYNKLNTDGTMNSWVATTSFTTARASQGGGFTGIWGAYIYLSGGCSTVNASGYCTAIASDTQLGSINADGSISAWNPISNLQNQRIGYSMITWQNGLYRIGGCMQQNASTGVCDATLPDVDYGLVNVAGEVSTVNVTQPSGSGSCTGGSPHSCDLPPVGDDAGEAGQMLSMSTVLNGYLYVIGGCIDYDCNGTSPAGDDSSITGNIAYVSIDSSGRLTAPGSCAGTSYGAWCTDATNKVNNTGSGTTDGVAAAGITTFNNRIYIVGGLNTTTTGSANIYYNSVNANGSLTGAWSTTTFATAGITGEIAYTYAYARANPSSAGTNPGNLYIFGGCGDVGSGAGCSNSNYRTQVYKCNISTTGAIASSSCTTTGQLQLDVELADETDQGLGIHSGTVYANYIYMIGGFSANVSDRDTVFYAKFDNSNNVVSVTTGAAGGNGDDWIESTQHLNTGRRRGFAFGYNGDIYAIGGYDASGGGSIIPFIEWAKMNVSNGSIEAFTTSNITINQRWGLSMVVSNGYAYVIGGCDIGASPSSCSSFEDSVQTFQLYNNDSGSANDFTAQSDDTFAANTDRWGASATVYNGYLYVAGGCISATDCTDATNNVQYAPISASDGTIGTWASGGNLPADRAWGSLEVAGGTLYYIGGQDDTATNEQSTVYYTSSISSGNPTWNGTAATNSLPAARTKFGSTVWNNRIYVVGGLDGSAAVSSTAYVSPQLNSGGNITSAWTTSTAFNVARTGAAVTSYANNLYLFGGFDGTNYLSDVQFASLGYKTGTISQSGTTVTGSGTTFTSGQVGSVLQYSDGSTATITGFTNGTTITVNVSKTVASNSIYVILDGSVGSWSYTTSLPGQLRDARAVSANGYIYLVGGRSAASTCTPKVLITPISANTTIATGNNPTGVGEWYETNVRYTGDRYGAAVAYENGKIYTMGGGCTAPLSSTRHYQSSLKSQPQVAKYSRMIDTDSDVFPNSWLMNGIDNSVGARWQARYRSMHDLDTLVNPNEDCGTSATMPTMTTWGQETNYGDVTLSDVAAYTPLNDSGGNINCARYYYFFVSIDASKTFGYPEDVSRGPTISDISLFFTSDPSKRLRHGKTFTGGQLQPLDTPCRQSNDANCPLP